jgi:hypothetical protein
MAPGTEITAAVEDRADEQVAADRTPYSPGWASAAIAIDSVKRIPVPLILRLEAPGYGPITIDRRSHAFDWMSSLSEFPPEPSEVLVETQVTTADAPSPFALPGRTLDPLLWLIGYNAFGGAPASWLRPGERYRLSRWPNLTELAISASQVQATAMLGSVFADATELAAATHGRVEDAQRMINAYSLIGILRSTAAVDVAPPLVIPATRGLFRRLRDRLRF